MDDYVIQVIIYPCIRSKNFVGAQKIWFSTDELMVQLDHKIRSQKKMYFIIKMSIRWKSAQKKSRNKSIKDLSGENN